MKVDVSWADGMAFEGHSDSDHKVMMDAGEAAGGMNRGARPMELLLMGLGGCSSIDVMLMLNKSRQDVTDCRVEIEAERANDIPAVFTKIHVHFVVSGRNIKVNRVERAIKLSADKYCSASVMLGKTAEITHDFEIIEIE
ncbi:MAG TPA: OsmC family protein [Gammaproteobacteria bacterium]|nr:OsmC family protein [Gammaproteobacteria bacterium]